MRRMMGTDAGMLYQERSPEQPLHTMKILVLDPIGTASTPQSLAETVGERARLIPPLRWVPTTVPGHLFHPMWRSVEPDTDAHIEFRTIDRTDREALAQAVSEIASVVLPRDRPLWQVTVLSGLDGGRLALALKLHHAVADGASSARILSELTDEGFSHDRTVELDPDPAPGSLAVDAARDLTGAMVGLPKLAARTVRAFRENRNHNQASAADAPAAFSGPDSLYNRPLTPNRTWAFAKLDFELLRAAKDAFGCSLNDVFLTLCGGAMRRHLDHHDLLPEDPLTTNVPVSVRTNIGDDRYGNRVGSMFTSLATDIGDPVDRLHEVMRQTELAKAKFGARDPTLECDWQELWPLWITVAGVLPKVGRKLAKRPAWNVITSNVKGPDELRFDGLLVEELHSMGPVIHDLGLNMTGWTYRGVMSVGVVACEEHVTDIWRLTDALQVELDALLEEAQMRAP
jgi:diacylglycerol O-acyltransferase